MAKRILPKSCSWTIYTSLKPLPWPFIIVRGLARQVSTHAETRDSISRRDPELEDLARWFPQGGLLVMDDLMDESSEDKRVLDLFTKFSHHQNITVLYLCQDMFSNGKYAKSISRNAVINRKNIKHDDVPCVLRLYVRK